LQGKEKYNFAMQKSIGFKYLFLYWDKNNFMNYFFKNKDFIETRNHAYVLILQ